MFDKTKTPQGENLALYPSRGTASVDWSSCVSVSSSCFKFLLGKTNRGRNKCPVDHIKVKPVTRNTDVWFRAKTLLVCCSSLKCRCVYAARQWCQSCRCRKALQDYTQYVHNKFVDRKTPCHLFSSKVSRSWEWKTFGIGDVNIFQPLHSKLLFSFAKGFKPVCYRRFLNSFGGLEVACWPLVPTFAGSNQGAAVGFLGRKNPQHAFLRSGSKTVGHMSQIYGM
jgi:hypothetical protein